MGVTFMIVADYICHCIASVLILLCVYAVFTHWISCTLVCFSLKVSLTAANWISVKKQGLIYFIFLHFKTKLLCKHIYIPSSASVFIRLWRLRTTLNYCHIYSIDRDLPAGLKHDTEKYFYCCVGRLAGFQAAFVTPTKVSISNSVYTYIRKQRTLSKWPMCLCITYLCWCLCGVFTCGIY